MATFPAIVNEAWSTTTSDNTSHTVNIPTGATGDLLLLFTAFDGNPSITWPAGYTSLQADTSDGDSAATTSVRYRVTDGGEGASISLTSSASERMTAVVLRITNFTGTPEAGTAVVTAVGTPSATPDPPSLTPSWGSADVLWVTWTGVDSGASTQNVASTIRSELMSHNRSGNAATDVLSILTAIQATASSRNPAAFNLVGSDQWISNTFAVQGAAPAAGGSGGQRIFGG